MAKQTQYRHLPKGMSVANSALLILDMQKDLCEHAERKERIEEILPSLRQAIDAFVMAGQPVFYICLELPADDPQFTRFGDVYCVKGTRGAEIIDELLPLRGPVISKTKHSAFFETDLDRHLKELDVGNVYLAGLQTQICVMTTAADASFRGYCTVAISDCVASTRQDAKQEALRWIDRYVGEVRTLADVRTALSRS